MKKIDNIPFSPPDISEEEINEVVDTLRGSWITTGPKTKLFEERISKLCGTNKTVCLNSATAALELILRVLGIGKDDEVIVPAYTYTASASPIYHVGAKIVICDVAKDSFEMDYEKLPELINENSIYFLCEGKSFGIFSEEPVGNEFKDENKIYHVAILDTNDKIK